MINEYIENGWKLTKFTLGTKVPTSAGWNRVENSLKEAPSIPCNVGLLHAYSGTMSLDIDDITGAEVYLRDLGVDLLDLMFDPSNVRIVSGRVNSGKLLFSLDIPLPTVQVKKNGNTLLEFRCGTASGLSAQDVLPPSLHPSGREYKWMGDWRNLPSLPEPLKSIWLGLVPRNKALDKSQPLTLGYNISEIREALSRINPDCCRDDWVRVGMAIYHTNSNLFHLWDDWSRSSGKYPGQHAMNSQWVSFGRTAGTTVTLATLFNLAKKNTECEFPTTDSSLVLKDIEGRIRPNPPSPDLRDLPDCLVTRSQEVAASVGCDILVPLMAGLGCICAAANAQSRLELVPGFLVPPVLWLMTVGDPGDRKSPGSKPMLGILKTLEFEAIPKFKRDLLQWEGEEAMHLQAKKQFLESMRSPEALFSDEIEVPEMPDLRAQPVQKRFTVNDVTSQKLVRQLADRPEGMLCYLDEMNSWVKKLTQVTSGEDRSAWVMGFEADRYVMDRVGSGTIAAENMAISIFGNIQPQVIQKYYPSLSEDGLLQRFIPVTLRHDQTRRGSPELHDGPGKELWEQAVRLVAQLPTIKYRLDATAFNTFREFQSWHEDAKRTERVMEAVPPLMGAFGKLEGLVGRLCLIFHLLDDPLSDVVTDTTLRKAIRFCDNFVVPSMRYFYTHHAATETSNKFVEWTSNAVLKLSSKTQITLSDIRAKLRKNLGGVDPRSSSIYINDVMDELEAYGWVKRLPKLPGGVASWLINPRLETDLTKSQNKKNGYC